jgi:hypothetical protein
MMSVSPQPLTFALSRGRTAGGAWVTGATDTEVTWKKKARIKIQTLKER